MALDSNDIFAKVCDIASDVLGVEADELSEATTFDDLDANSLDRLEADELSEATTFDDLDANSLDRLQLVTAMEDEFDIEIDDDKLMSINSVAEAIDAIAQTLGE